ncbi:MAG TPA: glycosyltransferase, partial [Marinagarivorans sp.]
MNILIAIDSLSGGGAEKVMLTLASEFVQLGHQCHVLALGGTSSDHELPPSVNVHFLQSKGSYQQTFPASLLKNYLNAMVSEYGTFDLHISNLEKTNLAFASIGLPRTLYVVHNSVKHTLNIRWKQPVKWWLIRRSLKALSGKDLIAVSNGVADGIRSSALITPRSLRVIHNPLDRSAISRLANMDAEDLPEEDYFV